MAFFDSHRRNEQGKKYTADDVRREIGAISADPGRYIRQAGVDMPESIRNDPRAMCMHLIQSGQVPQARMQSPVAQALMQRLMGGGR